MVESAPLLREYTLIAYRGFESLSLRQIQKRVPSGALFCICWRDEVRREPWGRSPRVRQIAPAIWTAAGAPSASLLAEGVETRAATAFRVYPSLSAKFAWRSLSRIHALRDACTSICNANLDARSAAPKAGRRPAVGVRHRNVPHNPSLQISHIPIKSQ